MSATVHFGGPDRPPRALRDLLEQRVDAVEPGGSIDWVTYYFRDEGLADALLRAHARRVRVRVCIEGKPRHRGANDAVIAKLRPIGNELRVVQRWFGASHLHTKLYCFGGKRPHALIGSFNPSGNVPEDPRVVADIGDQDRGHNLLVELAMPELLDGFAAYIDAVQGGPAAGIDDLDAGSYRACFFPRGGANPLDSRLSKLGAGCRLRIAASHFRDPAVARQLARIVEAGGKVEVLTHHTRRRSPDRLVNALRSAAVAIYRYEHPEALPMHAKFMLAEQDGQRWSAFGSYNLSRTSRWLNQELLVFSEDNYLWRELDARWRAITSEPWCRS